MAHRTRAKADTEPRVESPPSLEVVPPPADEDTALVEAQAVSLDSVQSVLVAVEPVLADWERSYLERLDSPRLRVVLEALTMPLDTRALELRARGFAAYRNGWFEEAYLDLNEAAELNRYDFTVHQVLGNLALVHRADLHSATEHFARAARYAAPVSPAEAALAHVSLAAVAEVRGEPTAALSHAWDALAACETSPEASYAAAKYLAATGADPVEVTACLELALRRNVRLCALAEQDAAFSAYRDVVKTTVGELKESLLASAAERRRGFAAASHVLRTAAGRWNDARIKPLIDRAARLHGMLAFAEDADPAVVTETLRAARKDGRALLAESAALVRELGQAAASREAGSRAEAESRSFEVSSNSFLYAILGCLAAVGVLALVVVFGLLAGGDVLTAAIWLLPVAGVAGLIAGLWTNRRLAARELERALDLSEVRTALDAAASELDGLREVVSARISALSASAADYAPV